VKGSGSGGGGGGGTGTDTGTGTGTGTGNGTGSCYFLVVTTCFMSKSIVNMDWESWEDSIGRNVIRIAKSDGAPWETSTFTAGNICEDSEVDVSTCPD
jgi:hypothetical protein